MNETIDAGRPIDPIEDIGAIKKLLARNSRDYLLFISGIKQRMRMDDLLNLKVKQVKDLKPGNRLLARREEASFFKVDEESYRAIQNYLREEEPQDDDYLFSVEGEKRPLSLPEVTKLLKGWARAAGSPGNYDARSFYKTKLLRETEGERETFTHEEIEKIKKFLSNNAGDLLLFLMGLDSHLNIRDLLTLKVKHVKGLKPRSYYFYMDKDEVYVEEKERQQWIEWEYEGILSLNEEMLETLKRYLEKTILQNDEPLFGIHEPGRGKRPLKVEEVDQLVKEWAKETGLAGDFNADSLLLTRAGVGGWNL